MRYAFYIKTPHGMFAPTEEQDGAKGPEYEESRIVLIVSVQSAGLKGDDVTWQISFKETIRKRSC